MNSGFSGSIESIFSFAQVLEDARTVPFLPDSFRWQAARLELSPELPAVLEQICRLEQQREEAEESLREVEWLYRQAVETGQVPNPANHMGTADTRILRSVWRARLAADFSFRNKGPNLLLAFLLNPPLSC
jgi:hypothetical protein